MRKIEAFKGDDTHVSTLHGAAMANAAASYAMRAGRGDNFTTIPDDKVVEFGKRPKPEPDGAA